MVKEIKKVRIMKDVDSILSTLQHRKSNDVVDILWYGNNIIIKLYHIHNEIIIGDFFRSLFYGYDVDIVKNAIKIKYNCGNYKFDKRYKEE